MLDAAAPLSDGPDALVIFGDDANWNLDALFVEVPRIDARRETFDVPRCTEGEYVDCVCGDGGTGVQLCDYTGRWTACDCRTHVPDATEPPPRLIAPITGLRVTSQRPTLRWQLPAGITRARVELCDDHACARRFSAVEVTGNTWRPERPLRPGVVFWRVIGLPDDGTLPWQSATWEFGVRRRDTSLDTAWGTLKDFDGDGYDDFVVRTARHRYDEESGFLVYRGQATGVELVRASRITGMPSQVALPGHYESRIGDFNADGLADLAVGAIRTRDTHIYYGTRSGSVLTPGPVLPPDLSFNFADFHGDGYPDLVTKSDRGLDITVISNTASGFDTASPRSYFMRWDVGGRRPTVSFVSESHDVFPLDVDGDGYQDVAMLEGTINVLYGAPAGLADSGYRVATPPWGYPSIIQDPGSGAFGVDFEPDGRMDAFAAAPRVAFHSFQNRLIQTERSFWESAGMHTTQTTTPPTDLDGDGRAEFVVTTQCIALEGDASPCRGARIELYPVEARGVSRAWTWGESFRTNAVAGAPGDINGDGFDDLVLVLGDMSTPPGTGNRLEIRYGGRLTPVAVSPWVHLPMAAWLGGQTPLL